MLNYIKKIIINKNKNEISLLDINIKRFEYISNSISKKKNEILESNDDIGSYYQNKIILPKNIKISDKEKINIKCFLYKILFSTISNNKNYYLPENKNNLDYILIASMLTVKTINNKIKKIYPNFKNLIRDIHSIIIKQRTQTVQKRSHLLELILKKLMYEKNKKKNKKILTDEEKLIIYEIENIKNINNTSLKKKLKLIYKKIINIHEKYEHVDLNILWGYLYHKKINKNTNDIKNILQNKKYKNEIIIKKNTVKVLKNFNKNINKNNLNLIFNYTKTVDNYKNGNKETENKNLEDNSDILKDLDINTSIKNIETNASSFKRNILNNTNISNIYNKKDKFKKYTYKEWDFKIKKYKNNWCNIFENKKHDSKTENKIYIKNITKIYKNEIKQIKEKISLIANEKIWKKKQIHGEDIDFDNIIDNYKEVKNEYFNNIYKFKKKYIKSIAIIILFDSSLSTDGYINEKKIIEFIKEIIIILNTSMTDDIPNNLIATFYSNTRHDCTYNIIKNTKEKEIKNIKNINPNGYTRIGPAIRHSIKKLKTNKSKKKIILIITDGNPTDYDEYEGIYGINDIKMAIKEGEKIHIDIKCIITNNKPDKEFENIFNTNKININKDIISKQLITFIKKILIH